MEKNKKPKIQNQLEYDGPEEAEMSDIDEVETAGYRTNKQQIESLIESGRRLENFRRDMYDADYDDDGDDFAEDINEARFKRRYRSFLEKENEKSQEPKKQAPTEATAPSEEPKA
ncbi:MAG: hypothetical protein FWD14_01140 [Treponema sp.]|nr:hypothetical protein [Treponema sp.]